MCPFIKNTQVAFYFPQFIIVTSLISITCILTPESILCCSSFLIIFSHFPSFPMGFCYCWGFLLYLFIYLFLPPTCIVLGVGLVLSDFYGSLEKRDFLQILLGQFTVSQLQLQVKSESESEMLVLVKLTS